MKTSHKVSEDFRRELQSLLDKYNAELEASDHWTGYAECGQDIRMIATIPAIYNENHDCTQEWTEVDLGNILFPSEP